jgi:ribose transport system ATP-binding protein
MLKAVEEPSATLGVGLQTRALRKRYGGVVALAGVDLDVAPGEIHGLLGENGAGKSTLLRIVMGVEPADSGQVLLDGRVATVRNLQEAQALGIRMIFQHQSIVPELSVAENFCLGEEARRFGFLRPHFDVERTRRGLSRLGLIADPEARMSDLSFAERQLVEIAKALEATSRVLILDEPTASLGPEESKRLFKLLRQVRDVHRTTIIYVSHRLEEIVEICNRITVMRDGTVSSHADITATTTPRQIAQLIVKEGGKIAARRERRSGQGPVILRVEDLKATGKLDGVSFEARQGEVLAVFGLIGSGRTELLQTLMGTELRATGKFEYAGRTQPFRSAIEATRARVGFVPEERHADGLFMDQDIAQNILSASIGYFSRFGFVESKKESHAINGVMQKLSVKAPSAATLVRNLSGGNQQKIVIGRSLLADARLLLLDEPTVGVDVGARAQIYEVIDELQDGGMTVVVVSSDIDEVLLIADRVLVMRKRKSVAILEGADINHDALLRFAFGEDRNEVP